MSARAALDQDPRRDSPELIAGLWAFAVLSIALALFMAIAPHVFYTSIGPFGTANDHYVRDVATFYAAAGVGLAVAVRRPSWRVPMLAVSTVQYALHAVNHLFSIGEAHPRWMGFFDFFALLVASVQLARLWCVAARRPSGVTGLVPLQTPSPIERSPR
jgi:hypothetical protein